MRIALLVTCLADTIRPAAARGTVAVLERLGHEVVFPRAQTCCGQMHANTGYLREAAGLARRTVEIFAPYEVIVCPSASCAGTIRHQYAQLAAETQDARLARGAAELAPRVHELSELLVDVLGVTDVGAALDARVAYHPTCHSLRALRVGDRPLRLLEGVRGVEVVPRPDAEECCGFGGTFAVKNADTSGAMLADTIASVRRTDADVLSALDASCLMHIGGGLRRLGPRPRTMHLAEILASPEPSSPEARRPGANRARRGGR
jgi:L-lactate dehydrogenase complex protein LldE